MRGIQMPPDNTISFTNGSFIESLTPLGGHSTKLDKMKSEFSKLTSLVALLSQEKEQLMEQADQVELLIAEIFRLETELADAKQQRNEAEDTLLRINAMNFRLAEKEKSLREYQEELNRQRTGLIEDVTEVQDKLMEIGNPGNATPTPTLLRTIRDLSTQLRFAVANANMDRRNLSDDDAFITVAQKSKQSSTPRLIDPKDVEHIVKFGKMKPTE